MAGATVIERAFSPRDAVPRISALNNAWRVTRPRVAVRGQSPRDLLLLQFAYLYTILGVWLASISIRIWMIGDAKRLRVEVPHARSFPLSISPKDIESEGYIPPVR